MDIVCHYIISTFFLSHDIRKDVKLHMIFNGQPDPPKHLEFVYDEEMPLSKKDVAGLIKRMLYKYKEGKKPNYTNVTTILSGFEKRGFASYRQFKQDVRS